MNVTATIVSHATGAPIPFTIRLLRKGDTYGLDRGDGKGPCRTHAMEDCIVEFYDARHDQTPGLGQFVSRYYVSTILDHRDDHGRGLFLQIGIRDWILDLPAYTMTLALLDHWSRLPGFERGEPAEFTVSL